MNKKLYCIVEQFSSASLMPLVEAFDLTSGTKTGLDTSYIKAIPCDYLKFQASSNQNIFITPGILGELATHLTSSESEKYVLIKNMSLDSSGTSNLNFESFSNDQFIAICSDVVFTHDYGVVAWASNSGSISVYIVSEEELKNSGGKDNFLTIYRENVGKKIKNKK